MNTSESSVVRVCFLFTSLFLIVSQTTQAQGNGNGPPTFDVNVANESLDVNLTNTVIQVESGTPLEVDLGDDPIPVKVDTPLDVNVTNVETEYARSPFYFEFRCGFGGQSSCVDYIGTSFSADFPPEGFRAIIEMVAARITSTSRIASFMTLRFGTDIGGDPDEEQAWSIPFTEVRENSWQGFENVRWYMDPDPANKVQASFSVSGADSSGGGGSMRISGYLVPLDSPSLAP